MLDQSMESPLSATRLTTCFIKTRFLRKTYALRKLLQVFSFRPFARCQLVILIKHFSSHFKDMACFNRMLEDNTFYFENTKLLTKYNFQLRPTHGYKKFSLRNVLHFIFRGFWLNNYIKVNFESQRTFLIEKRAKIGQQNLNSKKVLYFEEIAPKSQKSKRGLKKYEQYNTNIRKI